MTPTGFRCPLRLVEEPASRPAPRLPAEQPGDRAGAAAGAPERPERSLDELLAELDALIGLGRVKREVHRQVAVLRVEKLRGEAGLKSPTITRHLVFTGNPGTGKTTVARLVSGIYQALGLLSQGQLVEVDRSELVAGYLGQTATKTAEVGRLRSRRGAVHRRGLQPDRDRCLGGDQYGQEAVDTLVKEMEDRRDDLVVIVAGYPAPMAAFIAANPGLASRFRTTIEFEDYTDDELVDDPAPQLADGRRLRAGARGRRAVPGDPRPHARGDSLRQRPVRPQRPGGRDRPPRLAAARHRRRPPSTQLRQLVAAGLRRGPARRPSPATEPRPTRDQRPQTRTDRRPSPRLPEARRDDRAGLRRRATGTPPAAQPAPAAPSSGTGSTAASPDRVGVRALRLRGHARDGCGPSGIVSVVAAPAVRTGGRLRVPRGRRRPDPGRANTDQLVRIQAIQTNVVQADADATNAFLVGGLEPPAQRADYTDGDHVRLEADRRGRQQPARRRDGAGRAQRGAAHLHEPDRAGPGQQPPGPPDRIAVPEGRERRPARRRAAAADEPRSRPTTQRVDRGVRQRRHGQSCGSSSAACSRCWCSGSPWSGWPAAPAATSTCRWPPRRLVVLVTLVVGAVGLGAHRRARSTTSATASTPPRCPRRRPGSPGSTPSRTRA